MSEVLDVVVSKIVRALSGTPLRVELRFGRQAIEMVDQATLDSLRGLTEIAGLPVTWPEEYGPSPWCLAVQVVGDGCWAQAAVTIELLNDAAPGRATYKETTSDAP